MTGDVLLYDGDCGLCSSTVQLILRRERRHTLRFAALQSPFGAAVKARHPELTHVDSMIWLQSARSNEPERALVRSEAALRVASYLGGPWSIAAAARLVPRPIRDAVYGFIARHRHQLIGHQCFVPGPAVRARFIDL